MKSKELTPLEWLNYYKNKLQSSGQTIRPNGFDIIETALKDYEKKTKLAKEYKDINNVMKRLKTLEIIKENLNIDEVLLAIKGVCKASDYDLAKEVLL